MPEAYTNTLIHETSPYLLQHAHNPVDWMPWGEEALAKAKAEDKPLLISIGYSACHWCHVMEHESFEDTSVAHYMNEHFVCIKVDREERPDIDQVYMDAVQLMTGRGGWPLNCFALPDGRPFHGGTYFPKDQWLKLLEQVQSIYKKDRGKVEEYANKLTEGIHTMDEMPLQSIPDKFMDDTVKAAVGRWQKHFDLKEGGRQGAPKFPMPNNLLFLHHFGIENSDAEALAFVHTSLTKMAHGGIYDQVGGGFARYSTDEIWKVPHFEKMLYDNGQLLSLYAAAYKTSGDPLYRDVLLETVGFLEREMLDATGAFYSALDADSEGEEGKFYVWNEEEIKTMAGEDFALIQAYYHIDRRGLWEHGQYILMRQGSDEAIAKQEGIEVEDLRKRISAFKSKALSAREQRIRPGLDDKSLTSWNALTATGLLDAYTATDEAQFLLLAKANIAFLLKQQVKEDGSLWHSYKNERSTINGYLEDYAFLCEALIKLHEITMDQRYLSEAHRIAAFVVAHFERNEAGFFYFKSSDDPELVAKKAEIHDNVIPASNAVMATCLFKLGLLYSNPDWARISEQMLANVEPNFNRHPTGHSQWMQLHLMHSTPFYEVAIVGKDCEEKSMALTKHYLPGAVLCGGKDEGAIPILEQRKVEGKTLIYVCLKGACQLPVESFTEALEQMADRGSPGQH
ncbi:MAG: thioredoxin domain-containing protein [Flavobacteriales bacterium]|nr:thioredoxin domain-containing protein [Flavobacteriales bacterium]